mgnify:CR=1 FL=1|tara:strand:- start:2 stop:409 length:408 start_codon:yes stop_codon:yes gene_type:complete
MYINRKHIKETLEIFILPELAAFIKKRLYDGSDDIFKGEFYTLIRRHLHILTKPSGFSLKVDDISTIGLNGRTGEILSLCFRDDMYGSAGKKKLIIILNEILEESAGTIKSSTLSKEIMECTDFVNNFRIEKLNQ